MPTQPYARFSSLPFHYRWTTPTTRFSLNRYALFTLVFVMNLVMFFAYASTKMTVKYNVGNDVLKVNRVQLSTADMSAKVGGVSSPEWVAG